MRADFKVFLDACVLANFGVCDLLLRLAEKPRQYLPVWSKAVLDEVYRTHTEKLGWPKNWPRRSAASSAVISPKRSSRTTTTFCPQ